MTKLAEGLIACQWQSWDLNLYLSALSSSPEYPHCLPTPRVADEGKLVASLAGRLRVSRAWPTIQGWHLAQRLAGSSLVLSVLACLPHRLIAARERCDVPGTCGRGACSHAYSQPVLAQLAAFTAPSLESHPSAGGTALFSKSNCRAGTSGPPQM